jgi:hypothetical protein
VPRIGKVNWIALRTAYVVKGWTLEQCAQEFSVNPTTVRTRAAKEGWRAERDRNLANATKAATEQATNLVTTAAIELRSEHAKAVAQLNALLDGSAEDVASCKPGRSRAETRRACFESFKIALGLQRTVLGITDGQSSVADAEDDGKVRIVFVGPEEQTA